jgi:hypothetical protein
VGGLWSEQFLFLCQDTGLLVDTDIQPLEASQCVESCPSCLNWIAELMLVPGSDIAEGVTSVICR